MSDPLFSQNDLDSLIRNLQTLRESGFSLSISSESQAFIPLLEAMIDMSLRLKTFMNQGGLRQNLPLTHGLRFSEDYQDDLGNPLQIEIRFPNPIVASRILEDFFQYLAESLAFVRREGTVPSSFMELLGYSFDSEGHIADLDRDQTSLVSSSPFLGACTQEHERSAARTGYSRRHRRHTNRRKAHR